MGNLWDSRGPHPPLSGTLSRKRERDLAKRSATSVRFLIALVLNRLAEGGADERAFEGVVTRDRRAGRGTAQRPARLAGVRVPPGMCPGDSSICRHEPRQTQHCGLTFVTAHCV